MHKLDMFFGSRFHKRVFLTCLLTSIFLIVTSFFIPPLAIVDGSVLAAVGEIFGFAALGEVAAAVERGHSASISHGNTTIEIKKPEDENENIRTEEQYEETEEKNEQDTEIL